MPLVRSLTEPLDIAEKIPVALNYPGEIVQTIVSANICTWDAKTVGWMRTIPSSLDCYDRIFVPSASNRIGGCIVVPSPRVTETCARYSESLLYLVLRAD